MTVITEGSVQAVAPTGPPLEQRRYPINTKAPHLSPHERAARGEAARSEVPLGAHAVFEPDWHGRDPVALLEEQAESRVPELVPIRYGRMLVSPFAFYRGAALVQASDLATTPTSGLRVQLCGDAHLSNFGAFGSPERALVFDVNDFDETLPGPFEWDVKRLVGSVIVAGRERGFSAKARKKTALSTVSAYRTAMIDFAGRPNLDVWYSYFDIDKEFQRLISTLHTDVQKRAKRNIAKIRTKDSLDAFEKLTEVVGGERRIISNPPLMVPIEDLTSSIEFERLMRQLSSIVRGYRRTLQSDRRHLLESYQLVQVARKIVGVGSVGTRCWVLLMMGRDDGDPLFLQAKEAQASVLERYVGISEYTNHGQRVVAGQHLMQASSDIFLGWQRVTGLDGQERDFYIRQLRDWKGSAEIDRFDPATLSAYGSICGWTLARAHARSGDRIAIASYLGSTDEFDRAVAAFGETYADQNETDYELLQSVTASGRLTAETGV